MCWVEGSALFKPLLLIVDAVVQAVFAATP